MSPAETGRCVTGPVSVEVPATSANLGPGFDCLGLALDLRDTLTAEVVDAGLVVEIEGEGAADLPRDESHLVVQAIRAGLDALGAQAPGLRLHASNRIPQSRGLGSSSAAIVGGLALARALVTDGGRLDDVALLRLATRIEGHPDNVAPALLGGFVVSGQDGDDAWGVPATVVPAISAVAFVPPSGLSTEIARSLLPPQVSHGAAAANSGRAALLVAALGGATDALFRATEDFLHQEFRASAMPQSLELVRSLRAAGLAAVVSGAGPTVLVLTAAGPDGIVDRCPAGWAAYPLQVARRGVTTS
jgi:homoserine kinase